MCGGVSVTKKICFMEERMSELKVKDYRLNNGNTKDHSHVTDDRPLWSTNCVPSIAISFAKLLNPQKNLEVLVLIAVSQS